MMSRETSQRQKLSQKQRLVLFFFFLFFNSRNDKSMKLLQILLLHLPTCLIIQIFIFFQNRLYICRTLDFRGCSNGPKSIVPYLYAELEEISLATQVFSFPRETKHYIYFPFAKQIIRDRDRTKRARKSSTISTVSNY